MGTFYLGPLNQIEIERIIPIAKEISNTTPLFMNYIAK